MSDGLCECGCGQRTTISPRTNRIHGYIKGEPRRFILGHATRRAPVDYIVDAETGCWNWQLARDARGYPRKRVGGRDARAHRWHYEQRFGPISGDLHLHHRCENPSCVNPDHLVPLTPAAHALTRKDVRLAAADVLAIREATDSQSVIAKRYGITQSYVSMLRSGVRRV
jgi:hypothetical protein